MTPVTVPRVELFDLGGGEWALYRWRAGSWRAWITGLRAWRMEPQ